MRIIPWLLAQNLTLCNVGLFWSKLGCHSNSLSSLEISDSVFEFADAEILTIHTKNFSISCAELNHCNFGLILPTFGCHDNSLSSLENSGRKDEFTKPRKPHYTCEKFLDFLNKIEICAILGNFVPIWLPWRCCHCGNLHVQVFLVVSLSTRMKVVKTFVRERVMLPNGAASYLMWKAFRDPGNGAMRLIVLVEQSGDLPVVSWPFHLWYRRSCCDYSSCLVVVATGISYSSTVYPFLLAWNPTTAVSRPRGTLL